MNRELSLGSELLDPGHLDYIVEQTFEGIKSQFDDRIGTVMFPNGLVVGVDEEYDNEDRFPALIIDNERPARVAFNTHQYHKLFAEMGYIRGLSEEDMARLYIGCGITLKLLEQSFSPQHASKVDRFYTIMTDISSIESDVRSSGFTESDQKDQILRLMQSDEKSLCKINSYRFGIGALFLAESARGNHMFPQKMKKAFQGVMRETLLRRTSYIELMEGHGYSRAHAETLYGEHISEIELAICFPMGEREINRVLNVGFSLDEGEMPTQELLVTEAWVVKEDQ